MPKKGFSEAEKMREHRQQVFFGFGKKPIATLEGFAAPEKSCWRRKKNFPLRKKVTFGRKERFFCSLLTGLTLK